MKKEITIIKKAMEYGYKPTLNEFRSDMFPVINNIKDMINYMEEVEKAGYTTKIPLIDLSTTYLLMVTTRGVNGELLHYVSSTYFDVEKAMNYLRTLRAKNTYDRFMLKLMAGMPDRDWIDFKEEDFKL